MNVPENFNFGFDIGRLGETEPEKKALVWCDDHGHELTLTFTDIMRMSNQAANFLRVLALKRAGCNADIKGAGGNTGFVPLLYIKSVQYLYPAPYSLRKRI